MLMRYRWCAQCRFPLTLLLAGVFILNSCTSNKSAPALFEWQQTIPQQLIRSGLQAGDPWAMAHLHLALPQIEELKSQRQELMELMADPASVIPIHGDDGHRGEQHPHLLLRTAVLLSGDHIDPALVKRVGSDLAKTSSPERWQEVNDLAWLLDAAARCSLKRDSAASGISLAGLIGRVLSDLEKADQSIAPVLLQDPLGDVRRPSGLAGPAIAGCWAYTCSGTHLVAALVECDLAGLLVTDERSRLLNLLQRYWGRLNWELKYRRTELNRAVASGVSPRRAVREYGLAVTKLLGHGLEIMARAALMKDNPGGTPSMRPFKDYSAFLDGEINGLFSAGGDLPAGEVYDPVALLNSEALSHDSPVWERAFGDLCHLFRGLRLRTDPQKH